MFFPGSQWKRFKQPFPFGIGINGLHQAISHEWPSDAVMVEIGPEYEEVNQQGVKEEFLDPLSGLK